MILQLSTKAVNAMEFFRIDMHYLVEASTQHDLNRRLEHIKIEVRKRFKILSKQLHPDVGGSEDKMKKLVAMKDQIDKLSVSTMKQKPTVGIRVNVFAGATTNSTTVDRFFNSAITLQV